MDGRVKLPFKPVAPVGRQQLRHHQIPGKKLHDQRNIAEQLDIDRANHGQRTAGQGPQYAQQGAEYKGDNPGSERQGDGDLHAGPDPAQVSGAAKRGRLQKDAPVPIDRHR